MTDWKRIQTEYIQGNESIDALARKYGVNPNTTRYHFRKERWTEKRQAARRRADEIIVENAAKERAKLAALMDDAALALMNSILATIERHSDRGYTRLTEYSEAKEYVYDLLELIRALAELARLYGIDAASKLDRERLELSKRFPEPIIIDNGFLAALKPQET